MDSSGLAHQIQFEPAAGKGESRRPLIMAGTAQKSQLTERYQPTASACDLAQKQRTLY